MKSTSSSLMGRALLALLLTIGFYGLALAIAATLLFIPYAEIQYAHRLHLRLTLLCLAGAGVILWSIIPRPDRFAPPGPRLAPEKQPDLFNEVKDIAQKTGQSMPSEVYVVPEVNAFVAERGGFMGLGSRRVMGIGLPLLQALTVPQFRAVLAHEFGHYHGGDTKLGIWIYKTRTAIIRTVVGLGQGSWLQLPFVWYAKMFLRITHAVSRRQEFVADKLAAEVVGSKPLAEGLRAVHGVGLAFQAFWQNEFAPIINAGYRPPMAEGFANFISTPTIATLIDQATEKDMDSGETNPYDTHPSLRERIQAVQSLPPGSEAHETTPAISLLRNVPELEQQVFTHAFGEQQVKTWEPIAWQNVGNQVYLPAWKKTVSNYAIVLSGITPATLPEFLKSPTPLVELVQKSVQRSLEAREVTEAVINIVGRVLVVTLVEQGWILDIRPGAEIALHRDGMTLEPFMMLTELNSGQLTAEVWRQRCAEANVAQLDLGWLSQVSRDSKESQS
jgi:Zn-dependent protease with chaperone function